MSAVVRRFDLLNPHLSRKDGSQGFAVGVERLTVGFDRTWAPYVQTQLQLMAPDPGALAAIDPRTGFRCRFTLRQQDLQGAILEVPFDLAYRSRDVDWVPGTATAAASSDEALWQDYADGTAGSGGGYPANEGGISEVASVFGLVLGTEYIRRAQAPQVALNGAVDANAPVSGPGTDDYWAPGVTGWDYASQLAELSGAWLYADELGVFRFAEQGYAPDTTRRYFTETTNLIGVVDTVSRDDPAWANYAVLGFTPPNGNSTTYASSSAGLTPRKTITLARPRKKPTNGNPATAVRTKAQAAGRRLTLTAVADLACRPNQPATANYRGQSFSGTLESVAFSFPEGTMQAVLSVVE